jgi:hypothetical protein
VENIIRKYKNNEIPIYYVENMAHFGDFEKKIFFGFSGRNLRVPIHIND